MTDLLLLAFIFLVAGVVAVPIASRLAMGSVLGYLIAGIIISPLLVLLKVDLHSIQQFAEFGVVMMLFVVGLELQPKMLWSMRAHLLGLGGGQVVLTSLLVMGIAMLLGQPWQIALAIGLILALSSTAIVIQTLSEKGLLKCDGGQASFSVLLTQDIAVIPMLAFIPLLAITGLSPAELALPESTVHLSEATEHAQTIAEHGHGISLVAGLAGWQVAMVTIAAIAAVVLGGNYLITPVFRFIAAARLRELFTAVALMLVIGITLLMSVVGLSPALGTFLAGVVLANSPYRHELESDIEPFKGLLLGLFFMTVGASINFNLLFSNIGVIVLLTLALIAVKIVVLLLLGRLFNIRGAQQWLFAVSLAQAGEFAFVLLSFTVANNVIPQQVASQMLLVVALSMLLSPVLFIFYERFIAPRFDRQQSRAADNIEKTSDIIVAGHGRFGGIINRMLRGMGYETIVVDYNAERLEMLRKFDVHIYYGDATRPDLLHAAGIEKAKILIIAIDGKEQVTKLTHYVIKNYPHVHVIARAWDRDHAYELWATGCRDIIRETYDSSIRAGRSALEALGLSNHEATKMAAEFEAMDRRSMVETASLYRIDVPNHENPEYVAKVLEIREEWGQLLKGKMAEIRQQIETEEKDSKV